MPDHLERDQGGPELPEDNPALRALSRCLLHIQERLTVAERRRLLDVDRAGPTLRARWVRPDLAEDGA